MCNSRNWAWQKYSEQSSLPLFANASAEAERIYAPWANRCSAVSAVLFYFKNRHNTQIYGSHAETQWNESFFLFNQMNFKRSEKNDIVRGGRTDSRCVIAPLIALFVLEKLNYNRIGLFFIRFIDGDILKRSIFCYVMHPIGNHYHQKLKQQGTISAIEPNYRARRICIEKNENKQ